jgi:hypothetical protein
MGFLIDTSLIIAVERGKISAGDLDALTRQQPVYLSPVNLAEIRYGLERMSDAAKKRRALAFYKRLLRKPLLRITAETGEVFGVLAARLRKAGRGAEFRVQDLWLASQAVHRNLTLLTANPKDFRDVPGLKMLAVSLRKENS